MLDKQAIAQLLEIAPSAGAGFCDRICSSFLSSGELAIAGLRESLALRDASAFTQHAHRLKGASSMVGAFEVATLCAQLESRHDHAGPEPFALSVEIDELEAAVAQAQIALSDALRGAAR